MAIRNVVGRVEEAWGYTYGVWFSNNTIPSDTRADSFFEYQTRLSVNSKSGSNLTKVMWKVEILKAVYGSKSHSTGVAKKEFKAKESGWGMPLVALSELQNPKRGHLLNDACIVEAYISTDRTDCLISRELILETDLDKHKTKEKK
ncbi:hypothetical protein V6N13_090600 [Hibiscus sabdariffa]